MNIPKEWTELLLRIRTIAPDAILAGGALRDLDNGRPVKDLDVFVSATVSDDLFQLLLDNGFYFSTTCGGAYIDAAKEVERTYSFRRRCEDMEELFPGTVHYDLNTPELNIISLAAGFDAGTIINRVDFGLCQIAYLGDGAVQFTEAYERDKANRTFTLTRGESEASFDRSMKRFQRLSQKYPGWSLVIPREFHELAFSLIASDPDGAFSGTVHNAVLRGALSS